MKSTHSNHKHESLSYELRSELASEQSNEHSGARERSKQRGASERVSGASGRANGRASGPVLTSRFLAVLNHSGRGLGKGPDKKKHAGVKGCKDNDPRGKGKTGELTDEVEGVKNGVKWTTGVLKAFLRPRTLSSRCRCANTCECHWAITCYTHSLYEGRLVRPSDHPSVGLSVSSAILTLTVRRLRQNGLFLAIFC